MPDFRPIPPTKRIPYDATAEEAVALWYSEGGPYFGGGVNPRIWGHDLIHTMLRTSLNTAESEEIVGIYQAVLLDDPRVDKRLRHWTQGTEEVDLATVKTHVVPLVREFIKDIAGQVGLKSRPALNDDQIARHFVNAKVLSRLIFEEFGRRLGDIPTDELKQTAFVRFDWAVRTSREICGADFGSRVSAMRDRFVTR